MALVQCKVLFLFSSDIPSGEVEPRRRRFKAFRIRELVMLLVRLMVRIGQLRLPDQDDRREFIRWFPPKEPPQSEPECMEPSEHGRSFWLVFVSTFTYYLVPVQDFEGRVSPYAEGKTICIHFIILP